MSIIALLSAVAMPSYNSFKLRAQRTEAKTALMEIAVRQEQIYSTQFRYTDDLAALGVSAGLTESGLYEIDILTATEEAFRAIAIPAPGSGQTKDAECQEFSINDQRERAATPDPDGECW